MADSTMNSFLTTATCPQRHSHQLRVSGAAINQPLRGGPREEKLKKGNRDWEWHREIVRVWGENDSIHPQLQNSETQVHHPSVPHPPPLPSGGVVVVGGCILSEQTTQRNNP